MKLYAVSDSHGSKFSLDAFLLKAKDADAIVHLGDFTGDAQYLAKKTACPVYSVRGNCDFGGQPLEILQNFEKVSVLMTHGHMLSVKYDLSRLRYRGMEARVNLVLYGHTHQPMMEYMDGIFFVNPGSLCRPRGVEQPTYASIMIEGNRMLPSLYNLYQR